jgi:hypothetical protein
MLKRFILYFLFISLILSKDGLFLTFNSFQKAVQFSVGIDLTADYSLEEDTSEDFWHEINLGSGLPLLLALKNEKSKIGYTNSFLMLVHLKHVGPPPKYA